MRNEGITISKQTRLDDIALQTNWPVVFYQLKAHVLDSGAFETCPRPRNYLTGLTGADQTSETCSSMALRSQLQATPQSILQPFPQAWAQC